jgi:hypothetical protein
MKYNPSRLPDALLAEVSRDMKPVKPAPLPARLALQLAPSAVVISSVILLIGLRKDAAVLGPFLTWGASITQFGLAIMLTWIAARESTPARRLPTNLVWLAAAATALVVVGVSLWTFAASPITRPLRVSSLVMGLACGIGGTVAGTLLVVSFTLFFRRSLVARPGLAGALYGAGAGVAVNAGWRLACPLSTPGHAIGAHGLVIVATALVGAYAARQTAKRVWFGKRMLPKSPP